MIGAQFADANLSSSYFFMADLTGASLVRSNLSNANLQQTLLGGADLTGANLSGSYAYGSDLSAAILRTANLANANMQNVNFSQADMTGANTSGAYFFGSTWMNTTCPNGVAMSTECPA
jgi:uncharacterized protein YjbI with pentapeptide repeats